MMQSADHREGDDLPSIGGLALTWFGSVLVEREVGPGAVNVREVSPEDAPQVLLSEDDHVVEAFPSKGPDHALTVRILPRGLRRGQDLVVPQNVIRGELVAASFAKRGKLERSGASATARNARAKC
jgi:hypothetical protein